jgi:hypothetical protein
MSHAQLVNRSENPQAICSQWKVVWCHGLRSSHEKTGTSGPIRGTRSWSGEAPCQILAPVKISTRLYFDPNEETYLDSIAACRRRSEGGDRESRDLGSQVCRSGPPRPLVKGMES